MADYVQAGLVILLLIVIGLLCIFRSKSSSSTIKIRWIGYVLIIMAIFLVAFGILQYLDEASHSYGH